MKRWLLLKYMIGICIMTVYMSSITVKGMCQDEFVARVQNDSEQSIFFQASDCENLEKSIELINLKAAFVSDPHPFFSFNVLENKASLTIQRSSIAQDIHDFDAIVINGVMQSLNTQEKAQGTVYLTLTDTSGKQETILVKALANPSEVLNLNQHEIALHDFHEVDLSRVKAISLIIKDAKESVLLVSQVGLIKY